MAQMAQIDIAGPQMAQMTQSRVARAADLSRRSAKADGADLLGAQDCQVQGLGLG